MQIHDFLPLADVEVTGEGFLVAKATIARTGVQEYRAFELGLVDGDPTRIIKVYRPPEEVFADEAMRSFERKPVTNGHPSTAVDASNATQLTLGVTGDAVTRDQHLLKTTITVFDKAAVDDVQGGRRQLSGGYNAVLDFTPGTTPDGEAFDAVQRNIRGNHVALVDAGRCGHECRIGDCQCGSGASCSCGGPKVTTPNLKTITHDGVSIEVTDQGAQVIAKLSESLADSKKALADANTAHVDAIAQKDKELGEKDAEIAKLKDAAVKPEDIDRMVADRADVVGKAKAIADIDVSGKSDNEIRRAAVAAKLGDEKVKDKSDDYVAALFDSLAPEQHDPMRDAIRDGVHTTAANDSWSSNVFDSAGVAMRKEA